MRTASAFIQSTRYLLVLPTLFLVVCLFSASIDAREPRLNAKTFSRVDDLMAKQVEQKRIAGAVVRILHRGRVVKYSAYGMQDVESDTPMSKSVTDASLFRIASQTKAIVSVAVLMLQERGELLIADPVGRYLPEYLQTTVAVADADAPGGYRVEPAERPITVRDLLTHTAGIGYGFGPASSAWKTAGIQGWYFADRREPVRETIRRIAALPQDDHPGRAFVYGYNTDILGALVEVVSGQALDVFLAENILDPLGMKDTHFYVPPEKAPRLATVYGLGESGKLVRAPDTSDMLGQGEYVSGPRQSFSGGAGLVSTAVDYSRFLEALRNNGALGDARVLSRKSVELMSANHLGDIPFSGGQGFGLGLMVTTDLGRRGTMGTEGELSWGGAYHTSYWIDPAEELVVVYMTQLRPATEAYDNTRLRAAIYASLP